MRRPLTVLLVIVAVVAIIFIVNALSSGNATVKVENGRVVESR